MVKPATHPCSDHSSACFVLSHCEYNGTVQFLLVYFLVDTACSLENTLKCLGCFRWDRSWLLPRTVFIILRYWELPCLGFMLACCLFQINSLDMLRKKWPVSNHLSGTKWGLLMLFSWNEESMGVDLQVHLPGGGGTQVGAGCFYLASKHVQMYVTQSTNVSWCVREGYGNPIM